MEYLKMYPLAAYPFKDDGLTFNGLVGQLQKQESDIGYADLFVNLDRCVLPAYCQAPRGLSNKILFIFSFIQLEIIL